MKNKKELVYKFNNWRNIVTYENRFDNKSSFLEMLQDFSKDFEYWLPINKPLYRGRILDLYEVAPTMEDYKKWKESNEMVFQGYDKDSCGAPKNNATEGRLNGKGISFLYTCSDERTVIHELRPTKKELISIAEFIPTRILRFADLTREKSKTIKGDLLSDLLELIAKEFSIPHYAGHEYYFTQYLAGQFMNLDFDGIIFESSLNSNGENFVFFHPEDCYAVNSRIYEVEDINIHYSKILRKDI